MAQGEELELKADEGPVAILLRIGEVVAHGHKLFHGIIELVGGFTHAANALMDFFFQHGEEETFLAVVVGIERAAGIAGGGGNLLELGRLEAIARKYSFSSMQQSGACLLRLRVLGFAGRRAGASASHGPQLFFYRHIFPASGNSQIASDTCMYVY